MRELLRETTAYRTIAAEAASGTCAHAMLVLFQDEKYLRPLLKECAKAFFSAADGSRTALLIEEESYADCLFFPAAGGKLTVETASRILDESLLRPVEGEKKLFVLDAFHTVSALVQNKLLKLLEEPPAGVFFLLGATAEHSVLTTVLSRVRKIAAAPFTEGQIEAALLRNGCVAGAKEAAAASGGVYSAAETLALGGGENFRLAERFLAGADTEALCRELGERKDKPMFFPAVKLLLRDMLLCRKGERYIAVGGDAVKKLAKKYPDGAILAALRLTDAAEREIQFNANLGQAAFTLALGIREEVEKWQKLS